jgi:hypothetical protein
MKRNFIYLGTALSVLLAASLAMAGGKKTSLTGTWDCQAHGGPQGDMAFTLYLQENKETVDGNISSPLGATQITSGTFRHYQLELHFDMPQGSYTLMGKLEKGRLSGAWSLDTDKGTWEGNKHGATAK